MSTFSIDQKLYLIKRHTEEILGVDELSNLLINNVPLKHYIGFEISGKIHIGSGLMCMSKVKDFMESGIDCSIFLGDWHSWINDKLGGDRETIKRVATGYFKEGLKASFECLGGNPEKLKFVLGSELYHNNDDYWSTMVDVCKNTSLSRMKRSITILGRKEGENVDFAKLIYPSMQVADIFSQSINIAHAGLDQRKAHVIAREVALKMVVSPLLDNSGKKIKPIAIHHHLILGLQQPPVWPLPKDQLKEILSSMKMSKSIPDSAIFILDSPEEIRRKLNKAFCPEGFIEFNPVLDWVKHLLLIDESSVLEVTRKNEFGGDITYNSYSELERDFAAKKLHPSDLKVAVSEALIKKLEPIRQYFEKPKIKRMKEEMDNLLITR